MVLTYLPNSDTAASGFVRSARSSKLGWLGRLKTCQLKTNLWPSRGRLNSFCKPKSRLKKFAPRMELREPEEPDSVKSRQSKAFWMEAVSPPNRFGPPGAFLTTPVRMGQICVPGPVRKKLVGK